MEYLEQVKRDLAEEITGRKYDELTPEEIEILELDDLAMSWVDLCEELGNHLNNHLNKVQEADERLREFVEEN